MKFPFRTSGLALLGLILSGVPVPAQTAQTAPPPPAPGAMPMHPAAKKTPLERDMDQIAHAMRQLRKQVKDPALNASSLELVEKVHMAAEAALHETPAKAASVAEAGRADFLADYHRQMSAFIVKVEALEAALKAGDNAAAAGLYQQLIQTERQDHKKFRKPTPGQ